MRQVSKSSIAGEYKIFEAPPGYPGAKRSQWTLAEGEVRDAEPCEDRNMHATARVPRRHGCQGTEHLQPTVTVLTLKGSRGG